MRNNRLIPYLSAEALADLNISTADVVKSIEDMILGCGKGTVWSAPKAVILPEDGRYMMAALAAADNPPYLAVKSLVLNPENPTKNLPQINGLVTVLASDTGLPVAILDGNWITEVRTAGLSAVAATHMARNDSKSAAFIGCGVQARSHLKAFCDMFPLEEIRVFGRSKASVDRFCDDVATKGLKSKRCTTAEDAVKDADLIFSSVTYAFDFVPFLDARALKPGSFTSMIDLGAPWFKEYFSVFDQIIIDDLAQEASLPNKLAPREYITGDLADLVLGKISGRDNPDEKNASIFRGYALGDLALSALAVQRFLGEKSSPAD